MTRHRRHDPDDLDRDAPWRARYPEGAPGREAGGGYYPTPPGRPARRGRGALGTSSGRDDRPGEATTPPWDLPGWDDPVPAQRRPRDDGAHPSGPLPQVNSGPMQRAPSDGWPSAASGQAPQATGRSGYPHGGGSFPGQDDNGYLPTGSGYRGDPGGGEYPPAGPGYGGRDDGYDDARFGDSFPSRASEARHRTGGADDPPGGDYATGARYDEPGYDSGPGYAERDYPGERGYPGDSGGGYPGNGDYPGGDYPGQGDYAGDGGYPGQDYDYPDQAGGGGEPGYQDRDGYPAGRDDRYPGHDDTGYEPDGDYHDQAQPHRDGYGRAVRDDTDDHGYGDRGGWYGDVDEDQAWGDDDESLLPGFSNGEDFRRARGPAAPPVDRRPRGGRGGPPPSRPAGGKPKKRKRPMRRAAPWIALIVLLAIFAVAGTGFYYVWHNYLHPPDYSGPGTGSVIVQISPGETATQVGDELLAKGVVASVRAFSNAAKNSGKGSSLQPGTYRLHEHMAAALAFALLLNPSSRVELKALVTEGMRLSEIISMLGQRFGNLKGYEQAAKNVSALGLPSYAKGNPEGYLFPATYTIQPGTQPVQVLRAMVLAFMHEASSVNLVAVAKHDKISAGDAITIASLIQAEGKRPQDLPKIARVIYNRLNQHIKLQLDTTVLYARHSRAADVTVPQLNTKSPYNTYLHFGLPPGPIDSPGDLAIKAALHPAKGNWLYFLTVNPQTGLTKFTNSYSTFLTYVAQLNQYNATHH